MPSAEVTPISHEEFLREFTEQTNSTSRGDRVRLVTMQLEVPSVQAAEHSIVRDAVEAIMAARQRDVDAKLCVDKRYVHNATRIGNHDYPNWWPLGTSKRGQLRETAAETSGWLDQLQNADALQYTSWHHQSGEHSTISRLIASAHVLQRWAVVHYKGGIISRQNGSAMAYQSSGNITGSDFLTDDKKSGMNNIALRFEGALGDDLAASMLGLLDDPQQYRSAGFHEFQLNDWIKVVHDFNNVGEPGQLPLIHREAERMIDPRRHSKVSHGQFATKKPEVVVCTSQYAIDGRLMLRMLDNAARRGARVHIPTQPAGDYRKTLFPYNISDKSLTRHARHSAAKVGVGGCFDIGARPYPSHTKGLVVKYDDGTAAIMHGSDNYLTRMQKVVRNEEMATIITVDPQETDLGKREQQLNLYRQFVGLLHKSGELSDQIYDELVL